jgi:hypothetical protein
MFKIFQYRRFFLICSGLIICTFLLVRCIDKEAKHSKEVSSQNYKQFSGSVKCANCHKNIYESHIHTAHYLTTRPALPEYIKGNFEPGKNRFAYDPSMEVFMERRDSGFYQVGYYQGLERIAKRFDLVVGSGSKGQTYITRSQNRLYQLPVGYFTAANKWANSPQFPTHPVIFNRPITSRCLECHSTFVQKIPGSRPETEEFNSQIIYGVDCEKCHGPGNKHAEYQTSNPREAKAMYIINPARFSRKQNLDLCGLCHGGRLQKTKPSFEFIAGAKLSDYFVMDTLAPDPEKIDVHGNQLGLLRSSKCFQMSQTMTCTTCHKPHENERGKIALFSQRCSTCHNAEQGSSCKMSASLGAVINQNCIDCHMPLKASKTITELLPGDSKPTAALIRSHLIGIYPDETLKYKGKSHKFN